MEAPKEEPAPRWRLILICAAMAPLAHVVRLCAGAYPAWTDEVYSQGIFPALRGFQQGCSSMAPVSATEMVLLAIAVGGSMRALRSLRAWRRGECRLRRVLLHTAARLVAIGGLLYALFILVWGLNYVRLPVAHHLNLEVRPTEIAELKELFLDLAASAVHERSALRESAHGLALLQTLANDGASAAEEEMGRKRAQDLSAGVSAAYAAIGERLPWLAGPPPVTRIALGSPLLTAFGITGIYSPFSAEGHINGQVQPITLPFVACHEAAHGRGFAREDEANLIAWLVCRASPRADFRYSGDLSALGSVYVALMGKDFRLALDLWDDLDPGLTRDWKAIRGFWSKQRERKLMRFTMGIGKSSNDRFLKVQGQEDGVDSYGRMVDLLLAERRARLR